MEYLHRLPFMLSALVALVVGLISYTKNESYQSVYMKMTVCMVLTYLLGIYLRNTISKTLKEIEEKKEQEEKQGNQKETENSGQDQKADADLNNAQVKSSRIDVRIDDSDDGFEPLKVSKVIRRTLEEDKKIKNK